MLLKLLGPDSEVVNYLLGISDMIFTLLNIRLLGYNYCSEKRPPYH